MDLQETQDVVRWAAPKTWSDEIVARAARLLCDGRSVRQVARSLQLEQDGVARVQRVLRTAGVKVRFRSWWLGKVDLPGILPVQRPAVATE